MRIEADGRVIDDTNRQVGYIVNSLVFSGGTGTSGGQQVGYISGDVIYQASFGTSGGRQVGYVHGDDLYIGGYATTGGQHHGPATFPSPRLHAAAQMLLG